MTGCFGFCEKGPIVKVLPDNTFYVQVKPEDAATIVEEHLVKGRQVKHLLYQDPETKLPVSDAKHMDFYKKQVRIALRNCGVINPENIDEYIARDGYAALAKCLSEKTPQEVIDEIKRSGQRGRGGGGFPTGLKWEITSKSVADQKYVVCNADEGDPGAFMDRSILEGDPHSVIEAMAICGYCTGSANGLVYIRAEYPLAIQRLKTAIQTSPRIRIAWRRDLRHLILFRYYPPLWGRCIRLRRGDSADPLYGGIARRTNFQTSISFRIGVSGQTHYRE